MRNVWNKRILTFREKRKLRKLFWQKKEMIVIFKQTGLTARIIERIVNENNWVIKRKKYWNYLVEKAYRDGISVKSISKKADVKYTILCRIKREKNIKTSMFSPPNKRMTKEIELKIIDDYKGLLSSVKICKKYGFNTPKTVLDVLEKYKIIKREPKKITYYNTSYFEKVDTHDKAYILGLLLTDGYIIRDYHGFGIQLQEEDGYILKKIAKKLGKSTSVIPIDCKHKREKAKKDGNKNFINAKDMMRLAVYNKKMANDLKNLGIVKNKTLILRCPQIENRFLSSLFRGIWDGDGSIGVDKNNRLWCNIGSASKGFLEDLILLSPVFKLSLYKIKGINDFYQLSLMGGEKETIKFLRWMYKYKKDFYLKRKYEKVQNKIC